MHLHHIFSLAEQSWVLISQDYTLHTIYGWHLHGNLTITHICGSTPTCWTKFGNSQLSRMSVCYSSAISPLCNDQSRMTMPLCTQRGPWRQDLPVSAWKNLSSQNPNLNHHWTPSGILLHTRPLQYLTSLMCLWLNCQITTTIVESLPRKLEAVINSIVKRSVSPLVDWLKLRTDWWGCKLQFRK